MAVDDMRMDRLMKAILIRGEQLANVEGAMETAQLLQSTAALLNYFSDDRSWGPAGDEIHAMRDYGAILRSCFGRKVRIECDLPVDRFIRRRVLLGEMLEICSMDHILMEPSGKTIDIKITMREFTDDGTVCDVYARLEGNEPGEGINRACRC